MSTKRKLVVDKSTEEDCSSPAPTVAKKRKGRLTNAEKELRQMEMIKGKYVFAKIRKQQNSDGESIVNRFIRIPSRRVDSKFYEEIENPVDITQIQQKLKNPDYRKFEEFCNDIQLLVRNSKKYYGEESAEFKDAQLIEEAFEEAKQKVDSGEYQDEVEDSDDGREASLEVETEKEPVYTRRVKKEILEGGDKNEDDGDENEEDDDFEIDIHNINDLIATILEYTDSTGRLLCPPFRVLHSQTEFPLYYEKIDNPIDLKTIAIKGKEGKYETMLELKKDLNLLFNNAQTFSGIKSDIFKDAAELKKCVQLKSAKISEKGTHPKRRAKSSMLVDALITQTSADEHFSEDSEEDEDTENDSNPLWQLYWKIRNAKHEKDRSITLADHFLELPSKSFYPDYFDEIKTPISLFMINKKLKNGGYKMEELIKDLMQMYENAFEYNLETSEVYIAAEKLKQLTLTTAKQLEPCLDLSQFADKLPPSPTKSPPKHRVRTKAEIETDSDDESLTATSIKRKSPKKNRELNGSGRGRKSHSEMNEIMQNRHVMLMLWNSVYNHRISPNDSYWPAGAFIELPSPKQYPEYYQVIEYPIDMKMIRQKIDTNQYRLVEEMVDDIRKMFANAREFNEPKSNIHQDAIRLEQVLLRTYEAIRNDPSIMPRNIGTPARLKLNMKSISARGTPKGGPGRRKKHADGSDDEINRTINRSSKYRKTNEPFEMQMLELPEGEQKMFRLFYAIQNYRDETNRNLSVNFFRLPTREEFPGYYDVIRKPMDMMKIQQKLKGKAYLTLSDIVADFQLMFGNACRFNETGSSLYKDAVKLQQVLMELKQMFSSAEKVPKVQVEIRTIFISIFASIFNKKDEEGNCYSDELVELTEILKAKGVPESEWPFSLDQIKINIDKYRYRRLDRIQKDFFDLFETARQMAKIGSKMYKAAIALQKAFIIERDARCRGIISSNAYIVIEKDIDEAIKREAAQRAKEDDENDDEDDEPIAAASIKRNESEIDVEEIEIEGVKYVAPCYAYISRTDDKKLPLHILRIERIFKNENGDDAVQGFWVYRPEETLHLANRKFMKKEVFITPFRDTVLVDRLKGKCLVVAYQTFIEQIFTDFDEEDVYACEFKYYGKPKYFRKFKNWPYLAEDDELNMEKRKKVLTPKKSSVEEVDAKNEITAEGSGTSENDDDDDDDEDKVKCETVLDIDRYETEAPTSGSTSSGETTRTYFHQIRTATGKFYSLGQFVLVFNADKPLCDVMRIDKLWREKNGDEYFSGCWFARPIETVHDKSRLFWTNEVFAVYRNDETRKCSEIQNLCSVLTPKTYVKERQTDVAECDVFVCESMLIGCKEQPENCSLFCTAGENVEFKSVPMLNLEYASKTRKLKTYKLVSSIPNEEYFIFKTPISMENEISPLLKTGGALPLDHLDDFLDDDTDGSESVASTMVHQFPATTTTPMVVVKGGEPFNNGVNDNNGASSVMLTPQHAPSTPTYSATPYPSRPITTAVTVINTSAASAALAPTPKTIKSKSGYILFSAEVRKRIMHENPDAGFGEVSKIVGIEWKKLSEEQKKHYEVRAEVVAQEKAKQDAIKTAQERALQPGQIRIYQCKWANCDSQFDQEGGLHEHIIQHHTSQIIMDSDQQYVCMWVTCLRNRKDGKPFPSLPRLHRHMKEKHMPTSLRNVYQNQIGKNFFKLIVVGEPPVTQLVNAPYGRMPPPMPQQIQVQHQQQQPHPMNGVVNGHMQHHQQMMNGGGSMMQQQQQQQQHQQHQQQQQHHHQDHQQQQQQQQQHHGYQQMGNGMYQQMPTTSSHQSIPQQPYPQHHQYQQQYQTNQSHSQQQHQQQHQQQQQHHHHHHQQQQSQHQHQQQQQQHNQQQQQQQHQQQQVQQVIISDPGRTIVRAIAPVFVAPPNSIHSRRVLHSEAYLKYIESLSTNRQKSVSRWEKSIGATHRNTQNAGQQNKLPTHWIRKTSDGKPVAREEDVTKALWKLRDELLKNTCNLMVDRQTI